MIDKRDEYVVKMLNLFDSYTNKKKDEWTEEDRRDIYDLISEVTVVVSSCGAVQKKTQDKKTKEYEDYLKSPLDPRD